MMTYILLLLFLIGVELFYFRIASRFNIIDKPNHRSSHSVITVRGGGVIFPISILAFFILFGFQYPWFVAALFIISVISFSDDLQHQSKRLRMFIHLVAVSLTLYQANYFHLPLGWIFLAFALCIALINAYNFMDGINGITCGYAMVVIASLWVVNDMQPFVDVNYLYCLALGAAVFALFNARKKAICFAGDVGSISMALALIFPALLLIYQTKNLLFIGLFGVYGVDAGFTIIHRLIKRENITEAHRQHLFQYLANEAGWSHLTTAALYMAVQLVLSAILIYTWKTCSETQQWIIAFFVMLLLVVVHTLAKRAILKRRAAVKLR
jgi:UDP-N-acetylmuramyl pentapeptide phosphotransferase/UDP-N-acetylglucosamine-1-phosphate transferase